jgi:hypothetical protein
MLWVMFASCYLSRAAYIEQVRACVCDSVLHVRVIVHIVRARHLTIPIASSSAVAQEGDAAGESSCRNRVAGRSRACDCRDRGRVCTRACDTVLRSAMRLHVLALDAGAMCVVRTRGCIVRTCVYMIAIAFGTVALLAPRGLDAAMRLAMC